ncbi:helix-turn-helix domain-containing protein [uncultured Brevundimonas sp.]|uniref:helix-turn-helix domain-containing protein n=1 Tax=uncultured Brevundimonas sp. TaxID=213418 RepID=UPI0026311A22|nr:helix-turn-helix domain-containing protein [uncultured Brevundimonas sp.]
MSRGLTDGEIKALFRQLVKAVGGVEAAGVELGVSHQRVSVLQSPAAADMPTVRQIIALEVVAKAPVVSGPWFRAIKGQDEDCVTVRIRMVWTPSLLATLRAWREQGHGLAPIARALQAEPVDVDRALWALVGRTPVEAARALAPGQAMMTRLLAERAGRVVTFEALHEASRALPGLGRRDELADPRRAILVQMHQVRRRLTARGLDAGIRNVWGQGYRLSADGAARLRAVLATDFSPPQHPQERHP